MTGELKASFAWTATEGYEHFPPFVNLTGNRIAVRGYESFNGRYYEHGLYVAVELPQEAIDELRAALAIPAHPEQTPGTPRSSDDGEVERVEPVSVDDEETRAFIDGWNARLDGTDFDMALHFWKRRQCGI
jgi:hypothetical protein